MSEAWFFSEALGGAGETIELDPSEARHASASRRLSEGDPITLFDGSGNIAIARIREIEKKGRHVRSVVESIARQPAIEPAIHLACALPKGERQSVLLSMATQLGMTSFTPLLCERSVATPGRSFADRARRICIEACKQSCHAHLPVIGEPIDVAQTVRETKTGSSRIFIAHPDGPPIASHGSTGASVRILIGPEGGFTDDELGAAHDSGAIAVSLGRSILRIETAAVAALAFVRMSDAAGS